MVRLPFSHDRLRPVSAAGAAEQGREALRRVGWSITGAMLLTAMAAAHAGTERFDYDALGRLVRHIDSSGTITEYAYDAVGNILEVRRSTDSGPPRVSGVSPAAVRRGQTLRVTITGNRLAGARVSNSDPELDISGLTSAATAVAFTLAVSPAATLGARVFTVSTSSGDAIFSLLIEPQVPAMSFVPSTVRLEPGQAQEVTLTLSNSDAIAHTVLLSVANTVVASVSTPSITLLSGQTRAMFRVSGITSGATVLNFGSTTLGATALGIYVSAPFTGTRAAYAPPVGLFRSEAPGTGPSPSVALIAPNIGILRPEAPVGAGSMVGPILAPNVGVHRQ